LIAADRDKEIAERFDANSHNAHDHKDGGEDQKKQIARFAVETRTLGRIGEILLSELPKFRRVAVSGTFDRSPFSAEARTIPI
jgi:hypothetical protein